MGYKLFPSCFSDSTGEFFLPLKPIFHCDAKYLASRVGFGQCTRRQNFALPNAKYTNVLVYFALVDAPDAKRKSCVLPDAKPKRKPVEYRLHWVPGVGSLC